MTALQPEASAQAPWTRTMVGVLSNMAVSVVEVQDCSPSSVPPVRGGSHPSESPAPIPGQGPAVPGGLRRRDGLPGLIRYVQTHDQNGADVMAHQALRGRDREQAALDRLLDEVRAGDSRVLVLRGEAEIGRAHV